MDNFNETLKHINISKSPLGGNLWQSVGALVTIQQTVTEGEKERQRVTNSSYRISDHLEGWVEHRLDNLDSTNCYSLMKFAPFFLFYFRAGLDRLYKENLRI